MKLGHLTLCFLIFFIGLYSVMLMENRVYERSVENRELIGKACRAGVVGAADVLAEYAEGNYIQAALLTEAVEDAFEKSASAALGISLQPDCAERIRSIVPIICICCENEYIVIHRTMTPRGIETVAGKPVRYSSTEELSVRKDSGKCIEIIEKVLEDEIKKYRILRPVKGNVDIDLPVYAMDESVRSVSDWSIIAISWCDDPYEENHIMVHGAGICRETEFAGIEKNGRKEIHSVECEEISEYAAAGKTTPIDRKTAAVLGYSPSPCCDPLGSLFYDSMPAVVSGE